MTDRNAQVAPSTVLLGAAPTGAGAVAPAFRVRIAPVPLACCALEVSTALYGEAPSGAGEDVPADYEVLVVAGTVTHGMADRVRAAYDALPGLTAGLDRRVVVAFGACASTGGPYWDSYAVAQGVGTLIPVDLFVPGCPPRPETLTAALTTWVGRR